MSLLAALEANPALRQELLPPEKEEESKPKDWVKIGSIAVAALAGLVTAFAAASLYGVFPVALLGGKETALITAFGAGVIAAAAGGVIYYKFKAPKES